MNIPNNRFDPESFGLPNEAALVELASRFFPEHNDQSVQADATNAVSNGGSDRAIGESSVFYDDALSFSPIVSTAYSPVVLPYDGEVKRCGGETAKGGVAKNVGARSLESIRADFPILNETIDGKRIVWLDNAATTQRPNAVIDRLSRYYSRENSNVHRAAHTLAARSTDAYENARETVARFIGAPSKENIVFVRGTTEGINLVAQAIVKPTLKPYDEIILTTLEHHANIVPWQLLAQETGAVLRVAPIDDEGQIILSEYEKLFNPKVKFVSATHVSNALGVITPIESMIAIAHRRGVRILIDAAQSVSHIPIDAAALDADLLVFSGHKIYAPFGIGALYGKSDVLDAAKPYQGGGNMIADVTFERTLYQKAPAKFEAGTGSIADAAGLAAALEYVSQIGLTNIAAYERSLLEYATSELSRVPSLRLIGTAKDKAGILSFVLDGRSNEDIGRYLDSKGIAIRAGHHCAQPVLRRLGLEGTARASLAFYNTSDEIDLLVQALFERVAR
jgi:cysteine desulfurase/selenocysteine lyase